MRHRLAIVAAAALLAGAWAYRAVALPKAVTIGFDGSGAPVMGDIRAIVADLVLDIDLRDHGGFFLSNGIVGHADLLAMFQIESRFDPAAINFNDGGAGNHAYGIGQMLATTAADVGITNPNDLLNVETGVGATLKYMRWIYDFLTPRLGRAPSNREWVGAYNIGIGNVLNGNLPSAYLTKHAAAKLAL